MYRIHNCKLVFNLRVIIVLGRFFGAIRETIFWGGGGGFVDSWYFSNLVPYFIY